jgi:hypothetical protein
MSDRVFSRVPAATAAEVCRRYYPGRGATALLRDDMTPGQFLDILLERRAFGSARIFLANALPSREAVWWAVLCIREVIGPAPPKSEAAALRAAEAWVQDPSEANRRAAGAAPRAAGFSSPAGAAAEAAFQSGGSVGPPDAPEVPPKEYATARTVARAVLLAATHAPAGQEKERYPTFFARGIEVATGANRWTDPVETNRQPVDAMHGTDPQAATAGVSARTDPRAATNGASARTDPVTPSKRAARWQWSW